MSSVLQRLAALLGVIVPSRLTALVRGAAVVLLTAALGSPLTSAAWATGPPTWVWPTSGLTAPAPQIARRFEPPVHRWSPGHRGADLVAAQGSAVHAAGAGVVRFAGVLAGRGVVVIGHPDGTRTTYEPVRASVPVGASVEVGQLIGMLEAVGGHCLPRACLHWGYLRGDLYLDPLALLGRPGPPRLLPVWAPGSIGASGAVEPPRVADARGSSVNGPGRPARADDSSAGQPAARVGVSPIEPAPPAPTALASPAGRPHWSLVATTPAALFTTSAALFTTLLALGLVSRGRAGAAPTADPAAPRPASHSPPGSYRPGRRPG